jgi:hypothetical protein
VKRQPILLILLLLLSGCTRRSVIWVVTPATAVMLEFGLAQTREGTQPVEFLQDIRVTGCHDPSSYPDVFWEVTTNRLTGPAPMRIRYGVAPRGFETFVASKPLPHGCYVMEVHGEAFSATTRFEVTADGSVSELPRGQAT